MEVCAYQEGGILAECAAVEDQEELRAVRIVSSRLERMRLAGREVPQRSLGLLNMG